jgi:hypothetical protein
MEWTDAEKRRMRQLLDAVDEISKMYWDSIKCKVEKMNEHIKQTRDNQPMYWQGSVPHKDDFGRAIKNVFIDGKTRLGPWALMTPVSWKAIGVGSLGLGRGQMYRKQSDGSWLKVEG